MQHIISCSAFCWCYNIIIFFHSMRDNFILQILQYNVQKWENVMQMSLLNNSRIQNFNIITRQEFWHNDFTKTSYNLESSSFHLIYHSSNTTRMCFYVNKYINSSTWSIKRNEEDIASIRVKVNAGEKQKELIIHNIYNLCSIFILFIDSLSILSQLTETLTALRKHLIVSDFNLHHFY